MEMQANNLAFCLTGASPCVQPSGWVNSSLTFNWSNTQIVVNGTINTQVATYDVQVVPAAPQTGPNNSRGQLQVVPPPGTYMTVVSDLITYCQGCSTAVERDVTYQVMVNGQLAANAQLCEAVSDTVATQCKVYGPHGSNAPAPQFDACGAKPSEGHPVPFTDANGQFTDHWTVQSDSYVPTGCGWVVNYDTWQTDQSATTPIIPFGMLSGGIYTNSVTILGYTSTITNQRKLPQGMVIPPQAGGGQ